jgi:hypothetical protein
MPDPALSRARALPPWCRVLLIQKLREVDAREVSRESKKAIHTDLRYREIPAALK